MMSIRRFLTAAALAAIITAGTSCSKTFEHSHGKAGPRPWTHKEFKNNPENFQFAIVSDRCGGHRAGVFADAVDKLNLLQPEFVMSVGDLVEGYSEDQAVLDEQWNEFLGIIDKLQMRFFYIPGNHDIGNKTMFKKWKDLHGDDYYSFKYGDVLFLCLNAIDGGSGAYELGQEQVEWAQKTLKENEDARWTFVFLHVPLWLHDEGDVKTSRKVIKKKDTRFVEIQNALGDREYSVIAGHFHQYFKYERRNRNYYILSSTGGGSPLRGVEFGEFDHVVWVTMTDDGPVLANLLLDGIEADDVHTEKHLQVGASISFQEPSIKIGKLPAETTIDLNITNSLDVAMSAEITMVIPSDSGWSVDKETIAVKMDAAALGSTSFKLKYEGEHTDIFPVPSLVATYHVPGWADIKKVIDLPIDKKAFLAQHIPELECARAVTAPVIDGVLGKAEYDRAPEIDGMREIGLDKKPKVATVAWTSYDDENLYISARCSETDMTRIATVTTNRDGACWDDDCIELFLDIGLTRKTYHQIIINADGVVCDSLARKGDWNGEYTIAVGRENDAWTLEVAIPWSTLEMKPEKLAGSLIGFQLTRTRTQSGEVMQWSPTGGSNHTPSLFGPAKFK